MIVGYKISNPDTDRCSLFNSHKHYGKLNCECFVCSKLTSFLFGNKSAGLAHGNSADLTNSDTGTNLPRLRDFFLGSQVQN